MDTHTNRLFASELQDLRGKLLTLGGLVQKAIGDAVRSLTKRDDQLVQKVIEGDRRVNRLEVDIDELCLRILALRQPAASDLRFVTLAMKVVTDLERIGDLAVNIAESARRLNALPAPDSWGDLPQMAVLVERMLEASLAAFVATDANGAREVLRSDDEVDEIYHTGFRRLLGSMSQHPENVEREVNVLLATKHLERIADHATNVSEMVIFYVEGRDVRHPGNKEPASR